MREAMKTLASLAPLLFLTTGTAFADSPKDAPKAASKGRGCNCQDRAAR
jgi:hypothetical protein